MPDIPLPSGFSSAGDAKVSRISDQQFSDRNYKCEDDMGSEDWVPGYPPPTEP